MTSSVKNFLLEISQVRVVPVLSFRAGDEVVAVAQSLVKAGCVVLQVSVHDEFSVGAIAQIAKNVEGVIVGAGAVFSTHQIERSHAAGARFIVSPGISEDLVNEARQRDLSILPGVITPSDIIHGMELGLSLFHLHPVESSGGISHLSALSESFPDVGYYATGGVSEMNFKAYLAMKNVVAVGGSWMVPNDLANLGSMDLTQDLAHKAASMALM